MNPARNVGFYQDICGLDCKFKSDRELQYLCFNPYIMITKCHPNMIDFYWLQPIMW